MRFRKFLLILGLVLACGVLPLVSGCKAEKTEDVSSSFLTYVGEDGLYTAPIEGGEGELIVKGKHIYSPRISLDGRYIYFNNSSDIFVVSRDGGVATLAAPDARFAGFFEGRLLSCSKTYGVRAYDPETGVSESMVPLKDESGYVVQALASPDEKKIAASVRYTDVGIEHTDGVYIRYADIPGLDRFTAKEICGHADWLVRPLCWSADGGAMVFACGKPGAEREKVYTLPLVDGAASPLGSGSMEFQANSRIAISADGKTAALLAYRTADDLEETVCVVDLTRARCSYIPSGTSGVSGAALSANGSLVAYTSGGSASGLYVYANDTTLCVVGGDGKSQYAAPRFARNGMNIVFVGWGERLRAETDSEGNAVGTYSETVVSLYSAIANTAGSKRLVDGLKFPDGVYTSSWEDMYDFYEELPLDVETSEK